MAFELPPLPYDYSALEPVIDTQTMKLHHDMHHGTYVKNLNAALEKHPELQSKSAEALLRDLNAGDIQGAAAQFDAWDHSHGKIMAGLLRRREAETALFEQGETTNV